eukprot:TRINITY_DN13922_c0_g1_i1.p1 TRINITY_DN13922_c0_g1~~TRINITY_DN13922_c0_g1_i1.p1  ORF type:complete len:185 (+),score=24.38 TRINITY_DN13922_c0_g1_i1:67-621(+)
MEVRARPHLRVAASTGCLNFTKSVPPPHQSMKARCRRLEDSMMQNQVSLGEHREILNSARHTSGSDYDSLRSLQRATSDAKLMESKRVDEDQEYSRRWLERWREDHGPKSRGVEQSFSSGATSSFIQFGNSTSLDWGGRGSTSFDATRLQRSGGATSLITQDHETKARQRYLFGWEAPPTAVTN